jgi:fumarate hydratase class I
MAEMVTIREADLIESVADALQYISYFHPMDYIRALGDAYEAEQGPAAKDAIAQILTNSRMCAEGHRPICQDTGIVNVFIEWGQDCRLESDKSLQDVVDEGVRRAYLNPTTSCAPRSWPIRPSPAATPRDNTPCVLHVDMVKGNKVSVDVAAKGGGSENKSKFKMMNPSDSIVDWVLEMLPQMGAGWCPPGMLGIGIGGTAEHCVLLAKKALMEPIDMAQLKQRGPQNDIERCASRSSTRSTRWASARRAWAVCPPSSTSRSWTPVPRRRQAGRDDPQLRRHPPRALHARRQRPELPRTPKLDEWPQVHWAPDSAAKRVNLDTLTPEEVQSWKQGDRLLLNGKMLTGRDAAHKRIQDMLAKGEELPVDFKGRVIYYVGPVDPVRDEVVGPAGPTTATRMDKFMDMMLDQGLLACVGKAERGPAATQSIANHKSAYLMAVGGAAYLVARAIKEAKVVALDLGMEAIYEFTVQDMPVTVAVDSEGQNVHQLAPLVWKKKIADEGLLPA